MICVQCFVSFCLTTDFTIHVNQGQTQQFEKNSYPVNLSTVSLGASKYYNNHFTNIFLNEFNILCIKVR